MEMVKNQEQMHQHICKYCKKGFPCGRSLGGHMRSHMYTSTEPEMNKLTKKKKMVIVSNGVENSTTLMEGYELRENPKKTWRISDSTEKLICKECGKGFHSSKALFAHMKSHSEEDEDSWIGNQKFFAMDCDDQSEAEAAAESSKGKRRSRRRIRTRYNKTTDATCSLSNYSNAGSTSVSEIENEQEEVAICLMMLSRDVTGFNCLAESSGNNSVSLEAKSSKRFGLNENAKEKKKKKLGSLETVRFQRKKPEMDAGFLRIGVKKVESAQVSGDGFFRDLEFKKSKFVQEAEFEVFDEDFERDFYDKKRIKCSTAELRKNLTKESSDLKLRKCNSSNKRNCARTDSELKASYDASDSEICRESPKKSKFKCMTCNKTFHSYQALGGHRASHKKIKGCFASKAESNENSIEADSKLMKSINHEKNFEYEVMASAETSKHKHECPICFKVFSSGQALGGHKRSHLLGASSDRSTSQSIMIQKPEIRDLLDLNLPATCDEEDSGEHLGFKPWWIGNNNDKHEQLVGLFSN